MKISANTPIGEVVKSNFQTATLFRDNHIDFCCGGNKTISEACDDAGIDAATLIRQLEKKALHADPESAFIDGLEPDELIDYIVKRHHTYVRNSIPFLQENLIKICRKHGEHHPEVFEISELFDESAGDLTMHMQKEELILFPFIKKLVRAKRDKTPAGGSAFGTVANPIAMMVSEHETEGRRFEKIAGLSHNYSIPEDACATYEVTLQQLKDFENDLHRHIHLENNILFPKAIELEKQLTTNAD
jgi:regulator of cell morphogenesis and NO signaling